MKAVYNPKLTLGTNDASMKVPKEATSTIVVVTRAGTVKVKTSATASSGCLPSLTDLR